jgi:hypothetical protein
VSLQPVHFKVGLRQTGYGMTVEMDGRDISHYVRRFEVKAAVGEATTVRLELVNVTVAAEGDVLVERPPEAGHVKAQ